ncbi:MAG: acetate--CoA ligase [Candidatus Nealsonbacteria bacterium RBG_13_38_11]|uniref:Acetate--CoA ligase n=1 Tax=Candidatus Nealsonbacteria bacterium RBG_13_38_11 TaxID=1801662 RepID=A0A1G2DZR7_9BACT|nr:MAG: acetate--CoA ligase [Candidatus Nealsonbacteria bacterium RBG_13_38_11]HXK32260.1 acetate--CoA ligase [Candidatus Paceibacterota bacterium]
MIKKGDIYYPTEDFKKKAWVNNDKVYKEAAKDQIKFWEKLAGELQWQKKWKKGFEHQAPYFRWFLDGKINIVENCLDRHLKDKKDKVALVWQPEPIEEKARTFTYQELFWEVNKFANVLKKLGIGKGDRVGIYMPMIPEVIISMLACARIGAVHTVVFSAFSAISLQSRLIDSEAKILITADGYYRNGKLINLKNGADESLKDTAVEKTVVVKRAGNEVNWQEGRDLWWHELVKDEKDSCEVKPMDSEDPLFILYTSGSTGKPKGCLHVTGGYAVQAYVTSKWIFDLHDNDIFWSTADVGWITGHTYSCYGPLLCGATFVIFEGLIISPGPDRWAKIIDDYKVTVFYTAPTAIRMFEKNGAEVFKSCKLDTLRLLGSVGEPIDESAWLWYFREIGKEKCPIVDTWWQTETGGILITSLPGIGPFKPAFTGLPFPGLKFDILNKEGKPCSVNEKGNLVLFPPFAPGLLRGVYKNPEKYLDTYWSQYGKEIYFTSDGAFKDENGLIRIVGRVDDVIKVAGHRVSTGELEAAINQHPNITECAVIGVPDEIKGEVPLAFVAYKGQKPADQVKEEVIGHIKQEIGPIAMPKEIYLVEDLPKTRSGKIMRRILRKLFSGEELGDLSTLANPETVETIKTIIQNG